MKKAILGLICTAAITTTIQANQLGSQLYLEGKYLEDVHPLTIDYSNYLPARGFFEKIGAQISWEPEHKKITIQSKDIVIELVVDSLEATVNEETVKLTIPAKVIDGRVMIPLRFISENLGFYVEWVKEFNSVYIYSNLEEFETDKVQEGPSNLNEFSIVKASEAQYIIRGISLDNIVISEKENIVKIKTTEIEDVQLKSLKGEYIVNATSLTEGEETSLILTLRDDTRIIKKTLTNGIGLIFGDKPQKPKIEIEQGIKYSTEGHPVIRINKLQIDPNEITIKDDYRNNQIEIDLKSYQGDLIKSGKIAGADSYINALNIVNGATTKIKISEKYIQGIKVIEKENTIEFHLLKPREAYSKIVVLDVGHGGTDSGAVGNNVVEKSVNLKQALAVKELLEDEGDIKVYMTREKDNGLKLSERTKFSNAINPHIFISFHNNSAGSNVAQGSEVLYNPNSKLSKEAANIMLKHILEETKLTNRGIKARKDLYVLNNTSTPAILLEVGFVSNKQDADKLKDEAFNKRLAAAIKYGIDALFESLF